jgi:hypothetical protein
MAVEVSAWFPAMVGLLTVGTPLVTADEVRSIVARCRRILRAPKWLAKERVIQPSNSTPDFGRNLNVWLAEKRVVHCLKVGLSRNAIAYSTVKDFLMRLAGVLINHVFIRAKNLQLSKAADVKVAYSASLFAIAIITPLDSIFIHKGQRCQIVIPIGKRQACGRFYEH